MRNFVMTLWAAAAVMVTAAAASAQTTVLVMNSNQVLNEAKVGQHVKEKLQAISEEMVAELQAEGNPLDSEFQAFQAEVAALSQEALQDRNDLRERFQGLQEKGVQFRVSEQLRARELVATRVQALRPVREALDEILEQLVADRNADILVEREVLIFASEGVNVTQDVIDRLDARMTETPVERVRIERPTGEE